MQTAMQKLIDEIVEHLTYDDDLTDDSRDTLEKIRIKCERKLEMEKQQIIDAHLIGLIRPLETEATKQATEYFAETYGSKGSDDKKEPKDIVLGYKTSLEAQMLDSQIPQTEISDEEIMKAAFEHCVEIYQKIIDYENYDTYNDFIIGAKWYQEQLKSRQ